MDYPYATFNRTAQNYTGPVFGNASYASLDAFVRGLKTNCSALIGPGNAKWTYYVSECVWRNLTEQEKGNLSTYTYILTLWPAFLTLFASLGPDASDASWDNVLWGLIIALTSGSMAGFQSPANIPHHLRLRTVDSAREVCRQGEVASPDSTVLKVGRYSPRRRRPSAVFMFSQWVWLIFTYTAWTAFTVLFLKGLSQSFYHADLGEGTWPVASIWFFLSPVPALAEALARVMCNNVELYMPEAALYPSGSANMPHSPIQSGQTDIKTGLESSLAVSTITSPTAIDTTRTRHFPPQPPYERIESGNGLMIWMRIIAAQMAGKPYRLLVHPYPLHWLSDGYHTLIFFGRFSLLVVGSIQQSSYIVFPVGFVFVMSGLLVVMSMLPRVFWPIYWTRDRRGADLVVFIQRPLAADLGDILAS